MRKKPNSNPPPTQPPESMKTDKDHQSNLERLKTHYATLPRESLLTILQSVVETLDPMDVAEEIEELGLSDPPEPQPINLAAIQHAGVVSRESAVVAHLRAQGLIP